MGPIYEVREGLIGMLQHWGEDKSKPSITETIVLTIVSVLAAVIQFGGAMRMFSTYVDSARMYAKVIAALVALAALANAAQPFSGPVVGIVDGDTIKVMHEGRPISIRLDQIDTPELKQPFGSAAKRFTGELAFGKFVTVTPKSRDRWGRIVAEVTLPDGRVLNHEIVQAGMGWVFERYSRDASYFELQDEAKAAKRGLWADGAEPIAPWVWRKRQAELRRSIRTGH